jgi:hypothetical protein
MAVRWAHIAFFAFSPVTGSHVVLAADQPILLAGTSVAGASSSNSKRRVAYPVAT